MKLLYKPVGLFVSILGGLIEGALFNRAGATGFARLTGVWPGETKAKEDTDYSMAGG